MSKLSDMLTRHEDLRLKPYFDTKGKITIGIGRCLDTNGISKEEAQMLLENDIKRCTSECYEAFPWFDDIGQDRKDVIISMAFNLGLDGVRKFKGMIAAIEKQDFDRAASEMLNSLWASQVGKRATELARIMRVGW